MYSFTPVLSKNHHPAHEKWLNSFLSSCGHTPIWWCEGDQPISLDPLQASVPMIAVEQLDLISLSACREIASIFPLAQITAINDIRANREQFRASISLWGDQKPSTICQQAMIYAYQHLADPNLSIDVISKALVCSYDALERAFSHANRPTLWQWILSKRLSEAKRLLLTTALEIGEVAISVGYRDISTFSRIFKKHVGYSPSQWRKRPE